MKALRQYAKQPVLIGTATTGALCYPLDDSEEAEEKAYALSFPTDGEGIGFSAFFYGLLHFLQIFPGKVNPVHIMYPAIPVNLVVSGKDLEGFSLLVSESNRK